MTGRDADDFTIVNGVLRFKEAPDYETPTARVDTGRGTATVPANTYMMTVRATEEMAIADGIDGMVGPDRSDELDVMVTVQNEEENGEVSLSLLQPEVGTELTATPSDPDGGIPSSGTGAPTYLWYRAKIDAKPALAINPDAFVSVTDDAFVAQWEQINASGTTNPVTGDTYIPQGRTAQANR